VHLAGFAIGIYYDARTYERQIVKNLACSQNLCVLCRQLQGKVTRCYVMSHLRGQGLSGPVPEGRGADIHVQRCDAEPATVLLLIAGHAVAISDTFTASGGEESVSTRSQQLWELHVWARDDWRRSSHGLPKRTVGKWH
jgi:hypothetical protein